MPWGLDDDKEKRRKKKMAKFRTKLLADGSPLIDQVDENDDFEGRKKKKRKHKDFSFSTELLVDCPPLIDPIDDNVDNFEGRKKKKKKKHKDRREDAEPLRSAAEEMDLNSEALANTDADNADNRAERRKAKKLKKKAEEEITGFPEDSVAKTPKKRPRSKGSKSHQSDDCAKHKVWRSFFKIIFF
jgi:hypothetical protein